MELKYLVFCVTIYTLYELSRNLAHNAGSQVAREFTLDLRHELLRVWISYTIIYHVNDPLKRDKTATTSSETSSNWCFAGFMWHVAAALYNLPLRKTISFFKRFTVAYFFHGTLKFDLRRILTYDDILKSKGYFFFTILSNILCNVKFLKIFHISKFYGICNKNLYENIPV